MSSTRREPSLNPRQRRRRRLDSPSHSSVEVSLASSSQYIDSMEQAHSVQDGVQIDDSTSSNPPTRSHRSPTSSRLHRSGDFLPALISLDQIVAEDNSPSTVRHDAALRRIYPIEPDEYIFSSVEGHVYIVGADDWYDGPTANHREPFNLPVHHAPPLQEALLLAPPGRPLRLRDRAAEFYAIWRDFNNRHRPFPDDPSIVLLYKVDESSNGSLLELQHGTVSPSAIRYLPLVPAFRSLGGSNNTQKYMIQPSHQQRIDASQQAASRAHWVPGQFPVELFDAITQYLSRDDIKSMRLVNKEFERGVSRSLFDTVVVPFNTELYDMIEQERNVGAKRDFKGKRRADDPINNFFDLEPGSLQWKNAMEDREDKVYRGHGLKVFEGWGGHIRRFGMSFEIKEDALQNPPQKSALDQVESYFGSYDWPSAEYTRFEKLAGLERTADETSQMKLAFSHLLKVQQLALSMDSGLGWMSGPDRSLRSHILQRPSQVFGCSHGIADAQQQDRARLWETLETAHRKSGTLDALKEGHLVRAKLKQDLHDLPGLSGTPYIQSGLWSSAPVDTMAGASHVGHADASDAASTGALFVSTKCTTEECEDSPSSPQREGDNEQLKKPAKQSFRPAKLTEYQKEWLLEAEWAQRAFLSSYMLAIVDNSSIFERVTILNLARISSRIVPLFSRDDFWDALPSLVDVTLGVIPDWRTVERDEAGFVKDKEVKPSHAVDKVYRLLSVYVGPKSSVKKLKFSWTAGGEHAEGIFARNHHLLPAPVAVLACLTSPTHDEQSTIKLPHIEELTLSNCWIVPDALVSLVDQLRQASLKKLTLDSVSLTTHRQSTAQARANAFNDRAVIPGQFPAQFGAQVWQGPPPGVPHHLWARMMLQNMHVIMQQRAIQLQHLPHFGVSHPAGITMQQIAGMLSAVAAGGPILPTLVQPGVFFQQQNQEALVQPPAALPQQPPTHETTQPPHDTANQPWYEGHRQGSWVSVIDTLSPGPRLEMYRPRKEFDPEPQGTEERLPCIEFISCGYTQVKSSSFEQGGVEDDFSPRMSKTFARRHSLLYPAMLSTLDRNLGKIIQHMTEREQEALMFAWGFTMGWQDEKLAEEAEYDGYLPGGTGRFSGILTRDTPLGLAAHA